MYRVQHPKSGATHEFGGRIEAGSGSCMARVKNPPPGLKRGHPKRACFNHESGGWFVMSWYVATNNVDETIAYLEKTLGEALEY
jgi:hypothetical protein